MSLWGDAGWSCNKVSLLLGLDARKTCLQRFVNNKGADLISAFVIRISESSVSKFATVEIFIF